MQGVRWRVDSGSFQNSVQHWENFGNDRLLGEKPHEIGLANIMIGAERMS